MAFLCIIQETAGLHDFLEKMTIHLTKSSHDGTLQSVFRRVCGFRAPDTFRPQVATLLSESVVDDRLVAACSEVLEKSDVVTRDDEGACTSG